MTAAQQGEIIMKRSISITAAVLASALLLGGCGSAASQKKQQESNDLAKQMLTQTKERTLENTQSIHSLNLEIAAAVVVVQTGDDWKLETNVKKKYLTSEVKDGILTIEQPSHETDIRNLLKLKDHVPTVTLTMPKDVQLKKLEAYLGAGTMDIKNLSAQKSDLDVSAGTVTLDQLDTQKTNISCDLGEVSGSMRLTGDGSMDASVGSMELELLDGSKLAEVNANVSVGDVTLNGKDFSGSKKLGKTGGTLDVDCEMGSIDLTIPE